MVTCASIDVSDLPELRRVAQEVRDGQEPIVLHEQGEELAVVTPIAVTPKRGEPFWRPTPDEVEIAMSAFGSWKGLIDPAEFVAQMRAARGSRRSLDDL
jgi:hypothetical protein